MANTKIKDKPLFRLPIEPLHHPKNELQNQLILIKKQYLQREGAANISFL